MKTKIAIPMGDPAGVGPEIVVKTAVSKEILDLCDLVVIGDKKVLEKATEICQVNLKIHTINNVEEGKYEKGIANYDLFLVTTSPIGDEEKADLQKLAKNLNTTVEEISKIIANTLTETVVKILKETEKFEGIYSSGGDITIALLEKLKAIGVEIREEVIPLAAYGRIIGGDFPDLKLVSKGGMVGDEKTIKLCLHKIKNDI